MTLTTERQQFEEWFHEEIVLHISTSNEAVVRLMWKAWQASRELLANREAQPVAWRHDDGPFAGIAITRAKSVADSWIAKGWTVTPLYTAPPAPAVPPEATPENIENLLADITLFFTAGSLSHGGSVMFAEVWNACRAAMLAAVPEYDILEDYRAEMLKRVTFGGDGKSSCNANSPEIPEGWKLVPVEPTKEMINAALAAGCASIRSAYREMLAAAPESGNDHDTRR
ncbi:Uncharacterised protein [Serratia marcescens]|uniref:hypothetical protein n=1 Tax=Serratia TaxID=613 RepID=UPI0007455953|nr:hypothetical protein [Serratia marcescens]CUZ59957.1 Uncharacterised protein [Serratia marcescens]CVB52230.1 Uncharacterised protein [Serratia marcescens]CVB93630.1 Uncharacterised protein [Serratia marcescens]CVF19570.1 Uncharacterised protein [Serratia marcescens]